MSTAKLDIEELRDPLIYIPRYFKVLTKPESSGQSNLVPMVLWKPQAHYVANRTKKDICVKNRQQGFSNGVMASNAPALFTQPFERQAIITHDQETSVYLFQTIQRFLRNLPIAVRPKTDWKSGSRMRFPGLDSYVFIGSAQSDNLAIGRTLTRVHLSEMAKWPPKKAEELFADVSQTVAEHGYITIESTPKGRVGKFFQLYDAAKKGDINYKAFFYPWWWEPNYNLEENSPIALPEDKVSPLEYIDEEKELISLYKLTENQIRWRRAKKAELYDSSMDIDYFRQEYPENDIDCWLVKGFQVFPTESIRQQLFKCSAPYLIEENGLLKIWRLPSPTEKYVIGVDPASGIQGGDYSVAVVLEVRSSTHVATLRGRIPPEHLSAMVDKLGRRYNNALLAVERENHGHSVLALLKKLNYPNLYYHKEYDVSGMAKTSLGWITSSKSRPIMISDFASALKTRSFVTQDETILNEALGMRWKGDRAEAETGEHDDTAFAGMIAYSVRQKYSQYGSLNKVEVKGYGLYRS